MKQTAEKVLLPLLTLWLGFVVSPFLHGFWDWCSNVALPKLSKQQAMSLVATLATLCLVLGFAWYRSSSSSRLRSKYTHLDDRGFWLHRKTGKRFCGNCLIKGIESPLTVHSFSNYPSEPVNRWVCGNKDCDNKYPYEPGDIIKAD